MSDVKERNWVYEGVTWRVTVVSVMTGREPPITPVIPGLRFSDGHTTRICQLEYPELTTNLKNVTDAQMAGWFARSQ